ncbi:MAG: hypothetical protein G01um101472_54 [Parcubacteria group bacterium Gr01-1014_72]|nr:MAG: hypothetical protein G01um101472_54 [Parcubacteria group bacterium Gr01-1014_72]
MKWRNGKPTAIRNDEYGFEFRYPPDYVIQNPTKTGRMFIVSLTKIPNDFITFYVSMASETMSHIRGPFSCPPALEEGPGCPSLRVVKDVAIGSNRIYVIEEGGDGGPSVSVNVLHGDYAYIFSSFTVGMDKNSVADFLESLAKTLVFAK